MTYFEITTCRFYTLGNITSTTLDATFNTTLGPKADAKVDTLIYEQAKRQKKITYLPVLPLQGTDIIQTIKDAASYHALYLYFLQKGQVEKAEQFKKQALEEIRDYINKLKVEAKIGFVEF